MARLSPGRKDGGPPDPAELARNSGEKAALPILTFSALIEIKTGHDAMVTMPDKLTDILDADSV